MVDELVKKAKAFIARGDGRVLAVPEVVEAVGVNRRILERSFKAAGAGTVLDAIIEARLLRAARLLVGANKTIYEIAIECSFSTPSYLVSVFRRKFGMTTREFRRRCAESGFTGERAFTEEFREWLTRLG